MAQNLYDIQNHIEWADYINQRLENIYKELCEYEDLVNTQVTEENDSIKIMEFLETINNLHEAATNLRPSKNAAAINSNDLGEQINNLQRSLEILKLEINENTTTTTKTNTSNPDCESMEAD